MSELKNDDIYKGGHVFYFEPNDSDEFGKDQDDQEVSLTPHLEDLCIAMTLTADMWPRKRRQTRSGINDEDVTKRSISWISYVNGISGEDNTAKQILNAGVEMGGEKYLTTYYTEISADKYIENEMVEGLGVTNVNISYESWYTPVITINFVDVHGSALWGREEAIHDKSGTITADTILGVFFQQPYPLFRLQVKGFLGHEVTYQLSVSSFSGKYNSQTGNFEATATFIGYSYSLLTDIPLRVLSFVSKMSYVGQDYWEAHKRSDAWKMPTADGGEQYPIPLFEFIQKIESAIGTVKGDKSKNCDGTDNDEETVDPSVKSPEEQSNKITLTQNNVIANGDNDLSKLDNVKTVLNEFVDYLSTDDTDHFFIQGSSIIDGTNENQILLLFDNDNFSISNSLKGYYSNLKEAIEGYNNSNNKYKIENVIEKKNSKFHNALTNTNINTQLENTRIYRITRNTLNSNANCGCVPIVNGKTTTVDKLEPNGIKLFKSTQNELKVFMTNKMKSVNPDSVGEYAYAISLGNIYSKIDEIRNKIQRAARNAKKQADKQSEGISNSNEQFKNSSSDVELEATDKLKIKGLVGFEPTIGNFIKMVMCHLETFVEVMMTCADRIYNQLNDRTPSNFNISIDNTDIAMGSSSGKKTDESNPEAVIWPWPALYNPNPKQNNETSSNGGKYEVLGWPNDYPPKQGGIGWEEQNVILSAIEAIQKNDGKGVSNGVSYTAEYDSFPLSGSELLNPTPFQNIGTYIRDLPTLAPYLGLRAANLIGIGDNGCSEEIANAIGYMDALNLIRQSGKFDELKKAVEANGGDGAFADEVIKYLTCDKFDTTGSNGNNYNKFEFVHMPNNEHHKMYKKNGDNYDYVYTNAGNFSYVPTKLHYFNGNNNPYASTFNVSEKGIFSSISGNTDYIVSTIDGEGDKNQNLFTVITNSSMVTKILDRYSALRNGELNVRGYQVKGTEDDKKLESVLGRIINNGFRNVKYFELYQKSQILFPQYSKTDDSFKNYLWTTENEAVNFNDEWIKANVKCQAPTEETGLRFIYNNKEFAFDEMLIKDLPIMTNKKAVCSLFGTRLLYQQNNGNDESLIKKRKAYFVLHSLMHNVDLSKIKKLGESIFSGNYNHSIIDYLPPFYVYFIGALLWRLNYKNEQGNDAEPLVLINFKKPQIDEAFITNADNRFYVISSQENETPSYKKIRSYYNVNNNKMSHVVKNRLIELFETYACSPDFKTILDNCELKIDNNTIDDDKWKQLYKKWQSTDENDKNELLTSDYWKKTFSDLFGKYASIVVNKDCNVTLNMLISETNPAMKNLRDLYGMNGGFIVGRATSSHVGQDNGHKFVTLKSYQLKGYLNGFKARIEDACNNVTETTKLTEAVKLDDGDRDLAISFYYSLKHLWDTWLISAPRNQFTIQNFFNKYFVFIDSFYTNTYNTIKLNCEYILDAYKTENANLLSFITNVTSKEKCMFFALPTFVDSNLLNDGSSNVGSYERENNLAYNKDNLKHIFTPYTFSEMGNPTPNNVFVFVYTQPYSATACEATDKRFDSYMINETESWPGQLKVNVLGDNSDNTSGNMLDGGTTASTNNSLSNAADELVSARYAYYMPCFGVAVNRGNNYIFKSINVSMDSPKITAVSAQTYSDILDKTGNDATKRIFFHGQDIFQIYQQYAYSCEVEMLGCAQIQPLMYFQLLNIPMWRGTYMIYKVTHTMQPGMMTTKFVGMKMSRRQAPYASGYFTVPKNTDNSGSDSSSSSSSSYYSGSGNAAVGGMEFINNIFGREVRENEITSRFGYRNINYGSNFHKGVDIGVAKGTPLYAPWDGYVISANMNPSSTAGNMMKFGDTTSKNRVIFMHCNDFAITDTSRFVHKGELLAHSGDSGRNTKGGSYKAHAHIGLCINGTLNEVDPLIPYTYTEGTSSEYSTDAASANAANNTSAVKKRKVARSGINACIIGDNWASDMRGHFKYSVTGRNLALWTAVNDSQKGAIKKYPKVNKYVICWGVSYATEHITLQSVQKVFNDALSNVIKTHECYICTYPIMGQKAYTEYIQENDPFVIMNNAIKALDFVKNGKVKVIDIPDTVLYNNNKNINDSLRDYTKVVNIIKKAIGEK